MAWFSVNYLKLLKKLKNILKVTEIDYQNVFKKWSKIGFSNIKLTAISIIFFIFSWNFYAKFYWFPFWTSRNFILELYASFLVSMCGLILGTGLIGYIAHFLLMRDLFKFELIFMRIFGGVKSELHLMATFCFITATTGFIALSLLILAIRHFSLVLLFCVTTGTIITLLSYTVPQMSIHHALDKAKKTELEKITFIHDRYYSQVMEKDDLDTDTFLKLSAINNLRNEVIKTPTWVFDTKELAKLVASATILTISLIIKLL